MAVVNNVGNNKFVNDSCATGPDINVGDQMGMVDIVVALNSYLHDVAILHQQLTSSQQPEIVGNTNIGNESQEQGGDASVDNATGQVRENPDTGRQITTRTGTGKVAGYNELGTEESGTGQCANEHIPTRATCIKGCQNCCYGTEYQSVDPRCEGLTTKMVATCVDH